MSCKNCTLAREALMRAKIKEAAGYVVKAVKEAIKPAPEPEVNQQSAKPKTAKKES